MGMYLNPGNDGFASIIKGEYVDKTRLITLINRAINTSRKLICISRPRRFGKSFAAKMLCAYYSRGCDSSSLFHGLAIEEDSSFTQYLNKLDVIYLDITGFLSAFRASNTPLSQLMTAIRDSLKEEISGAYPDAGNYSTLGETILNAVSKGGHKFFFIIDEWDAIFREAASDRALQETYIAFLRELFKNGNVTDSAIAGAYMTGILPIRKYGHQSAISDFREYSMIEPGAYAPYVGFTEREVKDICDVHHLSFDECRRWYNGYSFVQEPSIYNPSSVMSAAEVHYCDSFWTRTETYESLKAYIDMDFDGLQTALVQLLGDASVPVNITTFQNDVTSFGNKDDILTLLIHLGYLSYDVRTKTARIPNLEIRKEFMDTLSMSSHKETARLILESDQLIADTLDGNEEAVAAAIDKAHESGTAPLFYNNEQALRAVVKAAYISTVNNYTIIEELPSGRGYADIVFIPKRGSSNPAMLVELKWNRPVNSAIEQIHNGHYPSALKGLAGQILLVGITYDPKTRRHTCKIEQVEAG